MQLPDGLAAGKTKIFQVNLTGDGRYAIFEYYTEYGDECVSHLQLVDTEAGSLEQECWIPCKALIAFVDHFRDALTGKYPSCSSCGESGKK